MSIHTTHTRLRLCAERKSSVWVMEERAERRMRETERVKGKEMDAENGGAELAGEAGLVFFSTPSLTDKQRDEVDGGRPQRST